MANLPKLRGLVELYFEPLIYNSGAGCSPSSNQAPGGICGVFYGGEVSYYPYGTIKAKSDVSARTFLGIAPRHQIARVL